MAFSSIEFLEVPIKIQLAEETLNAEEKVLVEIKNVTKCYHNEHTPILKDVSFKVRNRKICGLLAPKGAGKSTLLHIITGSEIATEGTVLINGYDISKKSKEAKRQIGYLPEQPPLFLDMTPYEYLEFVATVKGVKGDMVQAQIKEALALTGLTSVQDRLIRILSGGYKRRVGLAQTLLGAPDVIVLDEPMEGLDAHQAMEVKTLVQKLGQTKTVIISGHLPVELWSLCDQIVVLSEGKIIADDEPEALKSMEETLEKIFGVMSEPAEKVLSANFEEEDDEPIEEEDKDEDISPASDELENIREGEM